MPDNFNKLLEQFRASERGRNFSIDSEIAVGGMGRVFLAGDNCIGRNIAVKVLHDELQDNENSCKQFIEEARITGLLEHSNIIPIHALGISDEEKLFFTMKFVDGDPLSTVIERLAEEDPAYTGYYTQFTLLTIFRKICDAISFAHSKDIVHRDIKPENVMIGEFGEVLLMDWGIAKTLGTEDFDTSDATPPKTQVKFTATVDGTIKGSPAYMAPEQARGEVSSYDVRSDVFLLGATLYHMMTLQAPYYDEDVNTMVDKAEHCDFVSPKDVPGRQIPDELCKIILKAMDPQKSKRYQTAEEFGQAIDSLMSGQIMSLKKTFAAGEDIILHGDKGNEAFVILDGEVEVYKRIAGRKRVFTRLHNGDVFGEMAAITDEVRSASITAITDTTVLVITPDTLEEQLRKMPPWFEKIVHALSKRLRNMDSLAHPLLVSDCTFEIANQLKLILLGYGVMGERGMIEWPLPDLIYEISNNLKVPEERVRPVIAGLTEAGFCEIDGRMSLQIPNWNLFSDFVDFCKDSPRLSTTSTRTISTLDVHKVYTDGISVIHRHLRLPPDSKVPPLQKMKPLKDKVKPDESVDIKMHFKKKMEEVSEYANRSENLNRSMFRNQVRRQVFNPSQAPKISTRFKDPDS